LKVIKRGSKKGSKNDPKRVKNDHFGVILGSKMVKNSPLESFENHSSTPHELESRVFRGGQKRGQKTTQKGVIFWGQK
jgi:hypothetical protein